MEDVLKNNACVNVDSLNPEFYVPSTTPACLCLRRSTYSNSPQQIKIDKTWHLDPVPLILWLKEKVKQLWIFLSFLNTPSWTGLSLDEEEDLFLSESVHRRVVFGFYLLFPPFCPSFSSSPPFALTFLPSGRFIYFWYNTRVHCSIFSSYHTPQNPISSHFEETAASSVFREVI